MPQCIDCSHYTSGERCKSCAGRRNAYLRHQKNEQKRLEILEFCKLTFPTQKAINYIKKIFSKPSQITLEQTKDISNSFGANWEEIWEHRKFF